MSRTRAVRRWARGMGPLVVLLVATVVGRTVLALVLPYAHELRTIAPGPDRFLTLTAAPTAGT